MTAGKWTERVAADVPYTTGTLVADICAAAVQFGDSPAAWMSGTYWRYDQVHGLATQIDQLIDQALPGGVRNRIGVHAGRTVLGYAAMLAIMNRGDIYVPLSSTPALDQITAILDQVTLSCLLIDPSCRDAQPISAAARDRDIPIVTALGGAIVDSPSPRPGRAREDDIAYLLFTSGSTGRPKGVPVTHRNLRACLQATAARLNLRRDDRVTQFADNSFDVSIAEVLLTWRTGACLFIPSANELMTPCAFVRRHRLTVWSSVPTLAANARALERLDDASMPSLRWSLFCGEPLAAALVADWRRAAPASLIANLYGPTEATIFATLHVCDGEEEDVTVPIGTPLAAMHAHIDREAGHDGAGELLLAGPQVVRGYWRNEAASKHAFIRADHDGEIRRWYRTGDLVDRDARGRLVFRGRADRQVKIRGYRVELAAIEQAAVRAIGCQAAVAVPERDADGLCTSVVLVCEGLTGNEQAARRACRGFLPAYAVPRRIVALDTLPTTPSGKVDHRALARVAAAIA